MAGISLSAYQAIMLSALTHILVVVEPSDRQNVMPSQDDRISGHPMATACMSISWDRPDDHHSMSISCPGRYSWYPKA